MPSNMATGSISRPRWAAGWRAPAANCSPTPMRSCRCRCTGAGCGRGASTSRRCWRKRSAETAACRSPTTRSSGCKATAAAGRAVAGRARAQRAGRVPGAGERQGRGRRPAARAGRRRAHLRAPPSMPAPGHCCGPAPPGRRAGFRPGCRGGARLPYKRLQSEQRESPCADRNLHHPLLPLLPCGQGAADPQGRAFTEIDVSGDPSGAAKMIERAQRPHDGAADLHRRDPCRRLRRTHALDDAGKLDPLLAARGEALGMTGKARPSASA